MYEFGTFILTCDPANSIRIKDGQTRILKALFFLCFDVKYWKYCDLTFLTLRPCSVSGVDFQTQVLLRLLISIKFPIESYIIQYNLRNFYFILIREGGYDVIRL